MLGMNMCETDSPKQLNTTRELTLTEQLQAKKIRLQAQMDDVNNALTVLLENPQIELTLNLLQRVNRH